MHKADLHHRDTRLQKKLEAIYRLRRTTTKVNWDQEGYLDLLRAFGNPHLHLPPVIHVAGTNGKGSVIAFLRAICEAQGLRVHVYTSPHLTHVNERISLAGALIDDERLEHLIDQAMAYNQDKPLSFFEIITAIAFKAFCDVPADIVLLEVGMGGRLDCTNVVPHPIATIINRISMDHTDFLGDTIEAIAAEKAGIMKDGSPCIIGYQGDDDNAHKVNNTLRGAAKEKNINTCFYNKNYKILQHKNGFDLRVNAAQYACPYPSMTGAHQVLNAALAVAALDAVKDVMPVSQEAIFSGIRNAYWAGRLQKIDYRGAPDTSEIWLDSGHNDSAGQVLANQAIQWSADDGRDLHLIIGMLGTKDLKSFLAPLLPYAAGVSYVPIAADPMGSHGFQSFQGVVEALSPSVILSEHADFKHAVAEILGQNASARILIVGSVYLAGEVLDFIK